MSGRLRNLSIKQKLAFITLMTCAAVLILASSGTFISDEIAFRKSTERDLRLTARIIGNNSTAALTFDDSKTAQEVLSALRADQDIVAAAVYDKQGQLFAKYVGQLKNARIPDHPQNDSSQYEGPNIVVFQTVSLDHETLGTIFIQSDGSSLHAHIEQQLLISGSILVVSLLIAFVLIWSLQRVVSGPILKLAGTARRISAEKNYAVRAEKDSNDEVGALIDSFNEMIQQIH